MNGIKQDISLRSKLAVGFTIFASFFGAGNLIFPPALGLSCGKAWIWAFLAYLLMDIGLGALTLLAVSRYSGGFQEIAGNLGKMGAALIFTDALCLGPLACVPRTAAVTFELAARPLFPGLSSWLVTFVYFAIVAVLCIKPSRIVDIVGTVMTPVLLLGLVILIGKGIFTPAGTVDGRVSAAAAFKDGLSAGYQTMDMLVASLLSAVLIASIADKHYNQRTVTRMLASSSMIAAVGLFVIYGGLTYLGAVSEMDPSCTNAEILLGIVEHVMGDGGLALLAVIVTLACLTTAIGLISSCAQAVCSLVHDRIHYKTMVALMCAMSFLISNLGIGSILAIASPILELIYPAAIVIIVLSFLPGSVATPATYRWAAGCALAVAVYSLLDQIVPVDLLSGRLPLASVGLAWLIPTVVCGIAGCLISRRQIAQPGYLKA